MNRRTTVQDMWTKVDKTSLDGCWIWKGPVHKPSGYGTVSISGKRTYVHTFIYRMFNAIGDSSNQVHHTCTRKLCVNPAHLEALSPSEHHAMHNTKGPRG
jgi:hypothetical protein